MQCVLGRSRLDRSYDAPMRAEHLSEEQEGTIWRFQDSIRHTKQLSFEATSFLRRRTLKVLFTFRRARGLIGRKPRAIPPVSG